MLDAKADGVCSADACGIVKLAAHLVRGDLADAKRWWQPFGLYDDGVEVAQQHADE